MHFSGYLPGVLFSLPLLLSISAHSIDTSKTDALGSLLNRLLPRGDDEKGKPSSSSSSKRTTASNPLPDYVSLPDTSRRASVFSRGGGASLTLSNSRFPGRRAGGGRRRSVYGMRRCGLGFDGTGAHMSLENVDFDFGFWPIWFPDGYCGTSIYEYPSLRLNDTRPGSEIVVVDLQPNSTYIQLSAEEQNHTYYMFGDKDSVILMMNILVLPKDQGGCSTLNNSLVNWALSTVAEDKFDPGHALQWYRTSSFVLAYTGYSNSYAHPPLNTTSAVYMNDPLPSSLLTSEYLSCLNKTIGDALPIMDADADEPRRLTSLQIRWIVTGSIAGFTVLACLCCAYVAYGGELCPKLGLRRKRERNTRANIGRTIGPGSRPGFRKYDCTLCDPHSHRASNPRSARDSTHSLSSTLSNTPTLVQHPSSLFSDSREPDGGTSGIPRSPVGHRYNDFLTALPSSHLNGRDRANRMSVSSESSQGQSRSPSPCGENHQLLV